MNIQSYLPNLIDLANFFPKINLITDKINLVKSIDNALENNKLPKENITTLVFKEAEIMNILSNNLDSFDETMGKLEQLDHELSYFRQYLQEKYGYWATITMPFMDKLIEYFPEKNILELMAGNGYISNYYQTKFKNNLVFATDTLSWAKTSETGRNPLIEVEKLDSLDAFNKYYQKIDIIFLAWSPDFDEIDYDLLQRYRSLSSKKPLFFIIGEKYGATNSSKFWDNAKIVNDSKIDKINEAYSNYDIVHDKLYLIK